MSRTQSTKPQGRPGAKGGTESPSGKARPQQPSNSRAEKALQVLSGTHVAAAWPRETGSRPFLGQLGERLPSCGLDCPLSLLGDGSGESGSC